MKIIYILSILFLFDSCNTSTQEDFFEKNFRIEVGINDTIIIESSGDKSNTKLSESIVKLIPENELFFLKENLDLAYKLKSFYNYDVDYESSFYFSDLIKLPKSYYILIVESAFGGVNDYPCRKKMFLFKNNRFIKALSVSGVLGDGEEGLIYYSELFVKNNGLEVVRNENFEYESFDSENKIKSSSKKKIQFLEW